MKKVDHHIIYAFKGTGDHKQNDVDVPVFPTEHYLLTQLQRRGRKISKGFIDHLKYFIWESETRGIVQDLSRNFIAKAEKDDTRSANSAKKGSKNGNNKM